MSKQPNKERSPDKSTKSGIWEIINSNGTGIGTIFAGLAILISLWQIIANKIDSDEKDELNKKELERVSKRDSQLIYNLQKQLEYTAEQINAASKRDSQSHKYIDTTIFQFNRHLEILTKQLNVQIDQNKPLLKIDVNVNPDKIYRNSVPIYSKIIVSTKNVPATNVKVKALMFKWPGEIRNYPYEFEKTSIAPNDPLIYSYPYTINYQIITKENISDLINDHEKMSSVQSFMVHLIIEVSYESVVGRIEKQMAVVRIKVDSNPEFPSNGEIISPYIAQANRALLENKIIQNNIRKAGFDMELLKKELKKIGVKSN